MKYRLLAALLIGIGLGLLASTAHAQTIAVPNVFGDSLAARYSHRVPTGYCLTTRQSNDTVYVVGIAPPSEYRQVVANGAVVAVAFSCAREQPYLVVHPDSLVSADSAQLLTRAERMVMQITQAPFAIVQFGERRYFLHRPRIAGVVPTARAS